MRSFIQGSRIMYTVSLALIKSENWIILCPNQNFLNLTTNVIQVFFTDSTFFPEMPETTKSSERIKNVRSSTIRIGTPMPPKRTVKNKKRNSKNSVKLTAFCQTRKRRLDTITAKIWTNSMEEWQVIIMTSNSYIFFPWRHFI